jgi:FKBP-type peptidyl-prolyl cis-trans isomerase
MGRKIFASFIILLVVVTLFACGGEQKGAPTIKNDQDSMSYVVGMNIAYNILEMDSTINREVLLMGIEDALAGKAKMTQEQAKEYFLVYMNYGVHERIRKYEDKYLDDLVATADGVMRKPSGLTYKVAKVGDMNKTPTNDRDTVAITYRATRLSGEEVDVAAEREDTLRTALKDFIPGLKEGMKLIGEGGDITLWLPSSMAYGVEGLEEKGIGPNEMLRYELNILEVKKRY